MWLEDRLGEISPRRIWHVNYGGVRQQGRHLSELPLARRSREIWAALPELIGNDCEFMATGHLKLARSDRDMAELETYERSARQWRRRPAIDLAAARPCFVNQRNQLSRRAGDAINAVLAAVGYNFRRLLAWFSLLLRLLLESLRPIQINQAAEIRIVHGRL